MVIPDDVAIRSDRPEAVVSAVPNCCQTVSVEFCDCKFATSSNRKEVVGDERTFEKNKTISDVHLVAVESGHVDLEREIFPGFCFRLFCHETVQRDVDGCWIDGGGGGDNVFLAWKRHPKKSKKQMKIIHSRKTINLVKLSFK